MKGFPNQVSKLFKVALGMRDLVRLVDEGKNVRNDGIFGEALVRSGVAGRGHGKNKKSIAQYLRQQRTKPLGSQSFRTTARGLRELFELLGFIVDRDGIIEPTELGRQAAGLAGQPIDQPQRDFWRRALNGISHDGGDGETSHPYRVLLQLVARRPGISTAKSALALEAKNDSEKELKRIVRLADRSQDEIRSAIGVTKSTWANARKILPSFAEQLGDVIKNRGSYTVAETPGIQNARARREPTRIPAPRKSRRVTPETIARAGANGFDDVELPQTLDPKAIAAAIKARLDRLRRHNDIVRDLARRMRRAVIHEDPFDILAILRAAAILVEVKTLNGSEADERDRVKAALGQLLYYEALATGPVAGKAEVHKIACFESRIADYHQRFLNGNNIGVIWRNNGAFEGDELATGILRRYFKELL